jgi:phosphoglycerol transferase MdoB-like AlkP superfamily enzyme
MRVSLIKITFQRLALIMGAYTLCRLLFYIFNMKEFETASSIAVLQSFIFGLRFDLSIVFALNSLFTVLSLLPLRQTAHHWYQLVLQFIYYTVNIPFLFINLLDVEYFMFRKKRTTAEVLGILPDVRDQSLQLLLHYWYLPVTGLILVYLISMIYPRLRVREDDRKIPVLPYTLLVLLILGVYFIGIRGGLQIKPIRPNQAFIQTPNVLGNLVLNTPFSFLHTLERSEIKRVNYFSGDEEVFENLTIKPSSEKYYKQKQPGANVIIIILESFSSEYTGYGNPWKGYTPFLDSLSSQSLFFSHHLSNGSTSIEGLPAIIASIPALMPEPFITSMYQTNKIFGLGEVLKKHGYHSSFFHGGTNGTMGFDVFAQNAGFEHYYGMDEYTGGKGGFDGSWGIYDDRFLQYFCHQLTTFKRPFVSSVFTLSSHQPYAIPPEFKNKFPKGPVQILESIGYCDHALRKFFECARHQPWFDSTLFVITADHTQEKIQPRSPFNDFHVPLLFFHPALEKKMVTDKLTQHADIMPSIIDFLGLNTDEVLPFGHSVFDREYKGRGVTYDWGSEKVFLFHHDFITLLTPDGTTEVEALRASDTIVNADEKKKQAYTKEVKAIVQFYNNGLIDNSWDHQKSAKYR